MADQPTILLQGRHIAVINKIDDLVGIGRTGADCDAVLWALQKNHARFRFAVQTAIGHINELIFAANFAWLAGPLLPRKVGAAGGRS